MSAVKLKNVRFTYEGQKSAALDGVDFTLEYGELALLSGVSGSGKSTLMNIICGIIPQVVKGRLEGDVYVDGKSVKGETMNSICRKVGVVLQNADAQIIQDRVETEIAFGPENLGMPSERIKESVDNACERMQLDKNAFTRTLSGGQKQRLIAAAVLAMRQKILILDEPLANLDANGARMLMESLSRLAECGYAVMIIEHRLDAVMHYADRVWHLENAQLYTVKDKYAYLSSRALNLKDSVGKILGQGNAFSLENVKYAVGKREILRGIDLDIPMGGRTLITGENGCGKTTLLNAIAGLVPHSGEISGADGVSYMFQEDRLIPSLTALSNVTFATAHLYKDKKEAEKTARESLKAVGLEGFENRYPHTLSGGQAARVSLARAFAYPSGLLITDEPFKGLDIATTDLMEKYFLELFSNSRKCAVIVSHSVEEAVNLADRVVVLGGSPCGVVFETALDMPRPERDKNAAYAAEKAAEIKAAIIAS